MGRRAQASTPSDSPERARCRCQGCQGCCGHSGHRISLEGEERWQFHVHGATGRDEAPSPCSSRLPSNICGSILSRSMASNEEDGIRGGGRAEGSRQPAGPRSSPHLCAGRN